MKNRVLKTEFVYISLKNLIHQIFQYSYKCCDDLIGIGTVPTTPWASYELDARGMVMKDANGAPKLKGYCVEMIEEMARRMNFDYEISLPSDNRLVKLLAHNFTIR